MTQNSLVSSKKIIQKGVWIVAKHEKCTKLFDHFHLTSKWFQGASVYFLNRTKMFRGKPEDEIFHDLARIKTKFEPKHFLLSN